MKNKLCKSIICILLTALSLVGSVTCFAKGTAADEVNTLIGGITSYEAASMGVRGEQGIVDYYSSNAMTLGGEWYVLSFIRMNSNCDYSSYEAALINYLKNNKIYSATTREKFALTLIALNTQDNWAKEYIKETANEAIGKQGIMSLVFGLHLLNNGCKNDAYTQISLAKQIVSLRNDDGGWANSGTKSDVDVTSMTLEALYPLKSMFSTEIEEAVSLLSSVQSSDGDFKSYGVYNAESTCQVIIALSSYGIDADSDSRFVKNGKSAFDGLLKYKNSNGSFSHVTGDGGNNSATSQAFNALVAYSLYKNGRGPFYRMPTPFVYSENSVSPTVPTSSVQTTGHHGENTTNGNNPSVINENNTQRTDENASVFTSAADGFSNPLNEETVTGLTSQNGTDPSNTDGTADLTDSSSESEISVNSVNELITVPLFTSEVGISLSKELKIKLIAIAVIIFLAIILSVVLIILKKRNFRNFLVIGFAAVILIVSVLFIRVSTADDYYNSTATKNSTVGSVSIEVRCDTVAGKTGAPENPEMLKKTTVDIVEGETVYEVLAQVLREAGIPFEHNASYYISGIDNLYEFEYGDLSGWMYLVNGKTPSVGCGEYVLKPGDEIQWMYTCDIGNDLKEYEKN